MEKYPALYLPDLKQLVSLAKFGSEGCVVGRDPEVSVPIPDLTCSRRQFSVVARNGTYEVQPLSPGVPTLRNGVVLTSPQALSHDDRITCGTTTIVFLEGGAGFSLPRQAER